MRALLQLGLWPIVLVLWILCVYGCNGCTAIGPELVPYEKGEDFPTRDGPWYFDRLVFDIAPVMSSSPDLSALRYVKKRLHQLGICHGKAIEFRIREESKVTPPHMLWQYGLLTAYEKVYRRVPKESLDGRTAYVFVAYLSGPYMTARLQLRRLGGIQYSTTSFALFKDGAADYEGVIFLHEFYHLIGLRKTQNERPRHHCSTDDCLMQPGITSPYDVLCKDCLKELNEILAERHEEEEEEEEE